MTEAQWYQENMCDHAHCPSYCEHPQPFIWEGNLICGSCASSDIVSEMIPCTPENCEEH